MCKLFNQWKNEIENYCIANNLDFNKAQHMAKSWGKYDIALLYIDEEKGKNGLLDDSPAPVVLWINKDKNGEIIFKQTEYTKRYLM